MRSTGLRVALLIAVGLLTGGCAVFRPMLFWRDTLIVGRINLTDDRGTPIPNAKASGVTVNFINVTGKIEESVLSSTTDEDGRYRSPVLTPGKYKVEAMFPSFAIETQTVEVENHEHGDGDFTLKKIREAKTKSIKESQEQNIPNPGDVQIGPP